MHTEKVNQHLIGIKYEELIPHLEFLEDHVDCCGFASCKEVEHIPEHVDKSNLVLKDCVSISYDPDYCEARSVINFVFSDGHEGELILGYELSAGSGSGWSYGAYVQVKFNGDTLAEESW